MDYQIQCKDRFQVSLTQKEQGEITILHVTADAERTPEKLNIRVRWQLPSIGIHAVWAPGKYKNKELVPNWGRYEASCAMSLAPVYAAVSYDDQNVQTIACADGKNGVEIHMGVIEENGNLDCSVKLHIDYAVSHYETDIRIDNRKLLFYMVVDDVRQWWEGHDGYLPADVSEPARLPVYSTWYSFHQEIDVPAILEECRFFANHGCKTVIVDDGWQTDNAERGYDYCGDWRPTPAKIPDMKAFVDAVHAMGMKFVLWYAVPFVGEYSEAYLLFRDKMLCRFGGENSKAHVLDPRYPEVRSYLIELYRQAVLNWGLDGFKLDFVDSFVQCDTVREGMDYVSVYDAVDRLLKDVLTALRRIKPNIMIEFRQSYMGPLMRTFGNMLRSADCACDSWTNGMNTLALRMTSGETAVHSDMVMWNYAESAELAAFQLTHVLFSVPQISVRHDQMTQQQAEMVRHYLSFWTEHRETLLKGEMLYKGYAFNFPYVSACREDLQIGAVYAGRMAYIEKPTAKIVLVNASLDDSVWIDVQHAGHYVCRILDCCGQEIRKERVCLDQPVILRDFPVNGMAELNLVRE